MAQNPFHHNELQRLGRILGALSAGETDVFTKAFHFATTAPNGGRGHFNMAQLRQELPEYEPTPLMSFARKLESHGLLDIQKPAILSSDYLGFSFEITPVGRQLIEHSKAGNI